MGYTKYTGSDEAQYQYIVDTDSDIENLPTSAKGSMAMSIESGNFYALNSNNEWTSVGTGSSGGGGDDSGGDSSLVVECVMNGTLMELDKTWKEIKDVLMVGAQVVIHRISTYESDYELQNEEYFDVVQRVRSSETTYTDGSEPFVFFEVVTYDYTYSANSETDYPNFDTNQ